ncbi:MAG: MFS transporter [Pseudomonadota bacterium]
MTGFESNGQNTAGGGVAKSEVYDQPRQPMIRRRSFVSLWASFILGVFADNLFRQALIIGISFGRIPVAGFDNTDDALAIIGSVFAIAIMVFAALAGQVAERTDTAKIARRLKAIEFAIMATAAVGFYLNDGLLLIAALFAMGAQSAFFGPVRLTAMPKYFPPEDLLRANALFNIGFFTAILLGLAFGGALIAAPNGGAVVSLILLASAGGGYIASRFLPPAPADAPDLKMRWNVPLQAISIIRTAFKVPGEAAALLGLALFYFVSTFVTVVIPLYVRDTLGAGEGAATAIMGLFAIGSGLGAIFASLLARGRTGLGFAGAGVIGAGIVSVVIFFLTDAVVGVPPFSTPSWAILATCFTATAASLGLYVAPLQAAIQRRAPSMTRARIMAALIMLNAAAATLGSLSVLFVTRGIVSTAGAFIAIAVVFFSTGLIMAIRLRLLPKGAFEDLKR